MVTNPEKEGTLSERLAIALFAFMRQGGIKCTISKDPNEPFTYHFEVRDMTDDGIPFGMAFKVDSALSTGVEDTAEGIEKFCYAMALKTQTVMTEDKLGRLLQHVDKSKIFV